MSILWSERTMVGSETGPTTWVTVGSDIQALRVHSRWNLRQRHLYHSSAEKTASNNTAKTASTMNPIFVNSRRACPRSSTIERSKSSQKVIVLRSGIGRIDESKVRFENVVLISAFNNS